MATVTTLQDVVTKLDILTNAVLSNKPTLTIEEASAYTGLTVSYLYKLTSTQAVPHYKPRGKFLYFDRAELEEWLRQGRVNSLDAIANQAAAHLQHRVVA